MPRVVYERPRKERREKGVERGREKEGERERER